LFDEHGGVQKQTEGPAKTIFGEPGRIAWRNFASSFDLIWNNDLRLLPAVDGVESFGTPVSVLQNRDGPGLD
jgi:hypothetical protein